MERRPLRHQSFTMLWKILFLVVMELGIRNDLVDPDTGTPHEENEEEEELAQDPEIAPDDHNEDNGGSGSDDHDSDHSGNGHEPEEELNPKKDDVSSKSGGPLDGALMGSLNAGVNGSMRNGLIPSDTVVAFEEDDGDTPYDPFDRPAGEIITQVCPRSRSRSPRRSRSV